MTYTICMRVRQPQVTWITLLPVLYSMTCLPYWITLSTLLSDIHPSIITSYRKTPPPGIRVIHGNITTIISARLSASKMVKDKETVIEFVKLCLHIASPFILISLTMPPQRVQPICQYDTARTRRMAAGTFSLWQRSGFHHHVTHKAYRQKTRPAPDGPRMTDQARASATKAAGTSSRFWRRIRAETHVGAHHGTASPNATERPWLTYG